MKKKIQGCAAGKETMGYENTSQRDKQKALPYDTLEEENNEDQT